MCCFFSSLLVFVLQYLFSLVLSTYSALLQNSLNQAVLLHVQQALVSLSLRSEIDRSLVDTKLITGIECDHRMCSLSVV